MALRRRAVVWAVVALAALAVVGLLASGRLNASLVPKTAEKPAPREVQCFEADGSPLSSWSAGVGAEASIPRVDAVAVCTALIHDAQAVAQLDELATQQQVLGRDCVTFATTDGGDWALTGLQSSDKTYAARGGPAPGRLPAFGQVSQPAPLVSLAPAAPAAGCAQLPTVRWKLAVPPLAACTADDVTVSVYERSGTQTARELCTAKGLVVAGK
jgi:hypothetical protein